MTTELKLTGNRLSDTRQILFFHPGIVASNLRPEADNVVRVDVSVPEDVDCDLHPFRLITNSGISNLRLISVSSMPIIDEVESNNDFASPQKISLNATVHGLIKTEDVDYFAVDLKQGETMTVELEGLRLSYMNDFFDPFVAIFNQDRFEVARSDDNPLVQQDCICSFQAPQDGRYTIEVRESSFGGNDRALYRMHVGRFPRPVAVFPSGGERGQPLDVTWIDSLGKCWNENIVLPTVDQSPFKIWASRDQMQAPSPNYLRVNQLSNILEAPENDDPNQVKVSSHLPVAFNGVLESKGDQDWFGFEGKKNQTLEIRCFARNTLRSAVDSVVTVRKIGAGQLASNDDTGGPDGFISFKVPEDGAYAVGVRDHLGNFGPHYVYRLEVRLPEPSIHVTVAEQERYVSQTVAVPQGARMAIDATIVRRAVGGEAKFFSENLPHGLSMQETDVPADLGSRVVLFEATPEAPLQANLVGLQASLQANPELKLIGRLEQRTQIIRGQNNRDVWGIHSDKLAVAVTEAVPFDISVVQPQVPLVRNGSIGLVVKLDRKNGFDKAVSLRVLNPPPGVAASGSIKIEPTSSEATIPLTANSNAGIRTWPLTVIATTNLGRGNVRIASPLIQLEVADSVFEFKFNKTVTEQGKPVDILVGLKTKREVPGQVEFEVLGLPPGTSTNQPKIAFQPGLDRLAFPLQVPAETRQGNFKTIVCQARITTDQGVITQTNGSGEVQIDVPLSQPAAGTAVTAIPLTSSTDKPLSRLEQLRKEREAARGKQP